MNAVSVEEIEAKNAFLTAVVCGLGLELREESFGALLGVQWS